MSKEFNKLSTAVSEVVSPEAPPTEYPSAPQLTIQHALIMLCYAAEQNFGELTIPYQYVADKVLGTNPANLDIFQNADGSVTLKVNSADVRTRIIL